MKISRLALVTALSISLAVNAYLWYRTDKTERRLHLQFASMDHIEVIRTKGGLLQVSTIRSPESFKASKPHDILGIDLGPTTTRIRVPAVFNYHIELAQEWKVRVRPDKTVIVVAPIIKPTLPVAIDTAKLERYAEGRWSFLSGSAELDALQRTITQTLASKALSPSYMQFQQESARSTVTEFVRQWLLTQARWKDAKGYTVRVFFANEPIEKMADLAQPNMGGYQ
jgi:hypothetical protein